MEKKGSPFLVNQPPNQHRQDENDDESESFPSAPPPHTPKSILSQPKKNDGGTVTASIGLGPNQMVTNTYARVNHHNHHHHQQPQTQKQNLYQNFSVDQKKKSPQSTTTNNIYSSCSSSCSNVESNSVSSSSLSNLYEAKHRHPINSDFNETKSKLSNVRLDKHVIKYK